MASVKLVTVIDSNNPNPGDIYLENGTDRLTNSLSEEVTQLLYTRFRFFQGEWWLDPSQGVPWFQQILGQKTSQSIVSSILKQVVMSCPGIQSIDQFALTVVGRNWTLNFSVTLTNGVVLSSSDFAPLIIRGP